MSPRPAVRCWTATLWPVEAATHSRSRPAISRSRALGVATTMLTGSRSVYDPVRNSMLSGWGRRANVTDVADPVGTAGDAGAVPARGSCAATLRAAAGRATHTTIPAVHAARMMALTA